MTDDAIKIPVQVDADAAVAALVALGRHVLAAGQATKDAGEKAEASAIGWDRLVGGLNSAWTLASRVRDQIVSLVDSITELSAEQERLDANSARLSLDFDAAAAAAGKFADETEAMAAATRMAETGVRLTQTELNALMRVAGSFAQNTGTSVTDAVNTLTRALISGSQRGLRQFGADLVEVAGSSHTAGERLAALVRRAEHTAQASDNAADSVARLRDSFDDMKRSAASAFVETLLKLNETNRGLRSGAESAQEMQAKVRAIGQAAAFTATAVGNVVGVTIGGIAATIAVAAQVMRANAALATGDFVGAARLMGGAFDSGSLVRQTVAFTTERTRALAALRDQGWMEARDDTGAPAPVSVTGPRQTAIHEEFTVEDVATERANIRARRLRPGAEGGSGSGGGRGGDARIRDARAEMAQMIEDKREGNERMLAEVRRHNDAVARAEEQARDARLRAWHGAQEREEEARVGRVRDQREARRGTVRGQFDRQFGEFAAKPSEDALRKLPSLAESAALRVRGAYDSMSEAFGEHIAAVVTGQADLATALQNMVADTLKAISKMAAQEAGMEFARAIASLAVLNFSGAGLHAAAGAAYLAVAAATGAAGFYATPIAPDKPTRGSSSEARSAAPVSPQSQAATGGGQVINISFGTVIGAGGARQAAREIADVLNRGAIQGGAVLNQRVVQG